MYSYKDRLKAVKLYIKYDLCAADTVRELGYPDRKMLIRWYKEYQRTGGLHKQFAKPSKYTLDNMQTAVDYYLEHGQRHALRKFNADSYGQAIEKFQPAASEGYSY